jgi:hypothetical protein
VPSHSWVVPLHGAPTVVLSAMQVPGVVGVEPMQLRSGPQGSPALQEAPLVPCGWHCMVDDTHSLVRPQEVAVHDVPAVGSLPQRPHKLIFSLPQKVVAHCPLKAQDAPAGLGPAMMQAAGGLLVRKSAHEKVEYAATQACNLLGVFPVIGAASAFVHDSFSRVKQVAMSPKLRVIPAPFVQNMRLLQRACARSAQT